MKAAWKWLLILVLSLTFFFRVYYSFSLEKRLDSLVVADMRTYDLLAKNLIENNIYGFREGPWPWRSYRPPLYPFFVSIIYRAAGYSYPAVRLVQAFLAVLSCLLLFSIARDRAGTEVALVAAFLFAGDFSLIHLSGLFLSENLYLPLSLVNILLLERGFREKSLPPFIGAGVAGGLAALCRPTILPFLFLSGLVPVFFTITSKFKYSGRVYSTERQNPDKSGWERKLYHRDNYRSTGRGSIRRMLSGWLLMLFFAGLTICPWTARNYRIHRSFVPISTNGGAMLWMGLHHGAGGGYEFPMENNPLRAVQDEVERNKLGVRESVKFIGNYPGEFIKLAMIKMKLFWRGYLFTWSGRQWAIVAILGLGGVLVSLKEWRRWLLLYLYLISFAGLHLFVHSSYRYRLPLNPLIEIWAALFLVRLWNTIKSSKAAGVKSITDEEKTKTKAPG